MPALMGEEEIDADPIALVNLVSVIGFWAGAMVITVHATVFGVIPLAALWGASLHPNGRLTAAAFITLPWSLCPTQSACWT
jgi:hypothetical protein